MKVKNLVPVIAVLCFSCGGEQQTNVEPLLKGKLINPNGATVFLEQMSAQGMAPIDTCTLDENGEFSFDVKITEKGFYRVRISENNFATLILDTNEHVSLEGNAADLGNSFRIKGSPDSELLAQFTEDSKASYRRRDSLRSVFNVFINSMGKMDSTRMDSMSKAIEGPFDTLVQQHNRYILAFLDKNPTSFASLAAVQELDPNEFFPYFEKLDAAMIKQYPGSSYVQLYHQNLEAVKGLPIGSPAPELTMNTPEDKPFSLSSLKGKTVLIDFWASWCGPCRAENPNVVKAYKKYKSKGFEILGVSLDKTKEDWVKAIAKDQLNWPQISDLRQWGCAAVPLYKFQSIPTNYLLDKNGIILARNLRGEDLEKKLAEILH